MKVGLFIPCYINAIYPNVGVASYKLLKSLGVDVDYPLDQTCCGQPMANAGFEDESMKLALRFDDLFREYDYIVGPSASCVAFVKENHPGILEKEGHVCQSAGRFTTFASLSMMCLNRRRYPHASRIKSVSTTVATVCVNS